MYAVYLLCEWVGRFWDARRRCGGVSVSFNRGSLAQCDLDSCKLSCCWVCTFRRTYNFGWIWWWRDGKRGRQEKIERKWENERGSPYNVLIICKKLFRIIEFQMSSGVRHSFELHVYLFWIFYASLCGCAKEWNRKRRTSTRKMIVDSIIISNLNSRARTINDIFSYESEFPFLPSKTRKL